VVKLIKESFCSERTTASLAGEQSEEIGNLVKIASSAAAVRGDSSNRHQTLAAGRINVVSVHRFSLSRRMLQGSCPAA
jgi:hypothetical protein